MGVYFSQCMFHCSVYHCVFVFLFYFSPIYVYVCSRCSFCHFIRHQHSPTRQKLGNFLSVFGSNNFSCRVLGTLHRNRSWRLFLDLVRKLFATQTEIKKRFSYVFLHYEIIPCLPTCFIFYSLHSER